MLDDKQLRWRCRRGVRELDVLFGNYLEKRYPELDVSQQQCFQKLLEVQDPVIMDWLFGNSAPTADHAELVPTIERLRVLSGLA